MSILFDRQSLPRPSPSSLTHLFYPVHFSSVSSPSPTPTSSMPSTPPDSTPLSSSDYIDVVCNAPLVAPIPLPYLSPTFLQFHHLPDTEYEYDDDYYPPDASSPYYSTTATAATNPPRVPAKRKRAEDELVSFALLLDSCAFSPDYPPAKRLARWPSSCRPPHRLRR